MKVILIRQIRKMDAMGVMWYGAFAISLMFIITVVITDQMKIHF